MEHSGSWSCVQEDKKKLMDMSYPQKWIWKAWRNTPIHLLCKTPVGLQIFSFSIWIFDFPDKEIKMVVQTKNYKELVLTKGFIN